MNVRIDGRLVGKVAIVSGGAGGCGGAASELFAAQGAKVAIVDRDGDAAETLAARLRDAGLQAIGLGADVSKQADVRQAVEAARKQYGNADILFNHAGTLIVKPFLDIEESEWDWLMGVNVKSMFLMTQAVLPQMLEKGRGSIVCTSSISAVCATPGEVLYDATKGACHMFARAIAVEYRDRGIRCNALAPGFIRTPHGMRELRDLQAMGVDATEAAIAQQQGRLCEPAEVAAAALFLASDESSFVNGAHLFVDNCFSAV
ncbi:SDR family oxidoreductase [Burkholderia cenocepacia]|uniref:SDR family NAD(P)-dependent oxidoreductase n=1 Tax=Burkholderia cenocepacia TaxID=95486 RepID=UPI000234401A|nr:SDR family oxidoreductase [Burkholderia cenocepacia]MDN7457788.1 SDR family oxidoreductase [Burkholderia cenocepacia]MDN7827645.1 SDR family oxidoreductase [Burkholderia cenocepacia]MDR8052837.1 SDR family oxidoreductase [Burkholderia cenocepacia]MDV3099195.1 SDR family oxidoreductase [Burkholderia cenocepacia]CDN65369.1 3-oxoacyl-[acyl-carrier protein] reductase [Burkholderia cenocepacia H111]